MRRLLAPLALLVLLLLPGLARAESAVVIEGRGWGHGVGMSQYGAAGFAQRGYGYRRILAHYYRGTTLGTLPNRDVRVLVAESVPAVVVGASLPFRRVVRGERTTLAAGDRRVTPEAVRRLGGRIRFEPGASPLRVGGTAYRGSVEVLLAGGRLHAVNELSLDHYLRGVVAWEMPHTWHPEALRAQAVVARSYTLATLGADGGPFDLYSDTRDQVYGGIPAETPETNAAVTATAGRVVLFRGRVATTYYHSTSGGRTAAAADLWPDLGRVPYLVPVADPYETASRFHRWQPLRLTPAQLGARLGVGALRDVTVRTSPSGRVDLVRVVGARGTRTLPGKEFRDVLDLRSTWYRVQLLQLHAPRGAVVRGEPVALVGRVRGIGAVRLQKAVAGGGWQPVRRVTAAGDGRFRTIVRPSRPTRYRLVTDGAEGPVVSVTVRRR